MTSVAVIVLDTLRKDVFDEYFSWLPGVHFENAWSTANYTIPVHASLFTGKYASEAGVHAKSEQFDYPGQSIAEAASESGVRTRAYSANPLISLNGFDRGFDEFNHAWQVYSADPDIFDWSGAMSESSLTPPLLYPALVAKCLFDRDTPTIESLRGGWRMYRSRDDGGAAIRDWTQRNSFGDDEFLFINMMEAHAPYTPPEEYRTVELPGESIGDVAETILQGDVDLDVYWQAYHDSARYLADIYRDMFAALSEAFDVVITTADHGELFGEHGARAHFHGVYEELTHMPLVVSDGRDDKQSVDDVVSLLDVHATVADIHDLDVDSRGRSLVGSDGRVAPPGDGSYLTEYLGFRPHRLGIFEDLGFTQAEIDPYDVELFGLATGEDYYGHETVDGFVERGTATDDDLRALLDQLLSERSVREVELEQEELSEKTLRRLENLGYA